MEYDDLGHASNQDGISETGQDVHDYDWRERPEEDTLSDKAINFEQLVGQKGIEGCHIPVEDVKEFIRKLKDVCPRCYGSRNIKPKRKCMECERIDKLAGDKLI